MNPGSVKLAYKNLVQLLIISFCQGIFAHSSHNLPKLLPKLKPSIVGVGSFQKNRSNPKEFWGTGFVVIDGHHVITNQHVLSKLEQQPKAQLSIFVRKDDLVYLFKASIVKQDKEHDLALLHFVGPQLPAMTIGNSDNVKEGETYAYSGYPAANVLGLYPVTHRGMISAIVPFMIPVNNSTQLTIDALKKLRNPFSIFQLDTAAYPGNSGSPLYNMQTGHVIGVMNKVLLLNAKESALSKPSGISFAVPAEHIHNLIKQAGLSLPPTSQQKP